MPQKQPPVSFNLSVNKGVADERPQSTCAKSSNTKRKSQLFNAQSEILSRRNYPSCFLPKLSSLLFSLQLFSIAVCLCLIVFCQNNFLNLTNPRVLFADEIEHDDSEISETLLANPMEKYFDQNHINQIEPSDLNHNKQTQTTKSASFADRTIPVPIPNSNSNNHAKKQNKNPNKIKLTSANNITNNNPENNTNNIADSPNEFFDPFNAQAPQDSSQNTQQVDQNYNYNDPNNSHNYIADNQNNAGFYQPPNYTQQNPVNQFQPDQLQQYYQQFYNQYYPQYSPQHYSQYSPQYYPQYSPQYYPQYSPYFYGTYSPLDYGQSYNPHNFYTPENFYGNLPDSIHGSAQPQHNSERRDDLFESDASRNLERIARREAAETARLEAEWSPKPPRPILYPMLTKIWSCITTISPFNSPTGPDRGVGMPLRNGSWLDRPYYFGGFVGKMNGSELVSNMINQDSGANGGLILGYNMNEYWGLEGRLHFASIDIRETANGAAQYAMWYAAQNAGTTVYVPGLTTRSNQLTVLDVSVHYYPLGNSRFRPYFKYGLGFTREAFYDTFGQKRTAETMSMPVGIGLRYWWNKQFAIHADIVDNIIFSHDIVKTQSNWSFTVGLTYSFGNNNKRRPIVHWPYTPSSGSKR
ncbi:MAG: outer membrane beta-barrel protein [Planctomycetaceae bacterium]|jgi:hypothetical protein|nr:outer membrane beta-barrel protein [Planctomycetaceae bacterium]